MRCSLQRDSERLCVNFNRARSARLLRIGMTLDPDWPGTRVSPLGKRGRDELGCRLRVKEVTELPRWRRRRRGTFRPSMKTFMSLLILVASVFLASASAGELVVSFDSAPGGHGFKILRDESVQFPVVLMHDGITHGEARILLEVDAEGRLIDTLVLAYTHRPFADAALAAIRHWKFEPGTLNGEAVADCSFVFAVEGTVFYTRFGPPVFERRDPFKPRFDYQAQELIALDCTPSPQRVVSPIYPKAYADQGMQGQVTIDFFIDEKGAVRMPSAVGGAYPLLAAAATAAIREWRFSPPLLRGRPVLAHCEQVFSFEPDSSPP